MLKPVLEVISDMSVLLTKANQIEENSYSLATKISNDQEMAQSKRNFHFKIQGGEKTKLIVRL